MPVDCSKCGHTHDDFVPLSRFNEANNAKGSLAKQLEDAKKSLADQAALQAELETYKAKAASADTMQATIDDLQKQAAGFATEKVLLEQGITDPHGRRDVQAMWGAIPEAERPEGGLEAWLTNRDSLRPGVLAYLPPSKNGGAETREKTGSSSTRDAPPAGSQSQPGTSKPPPGESQGQNKTIIDPNAGVSGNGPSVFAEGTIKNQSPDEYRKNRSRYLAEHGIDQLGGLAGPYRQ